ncbi:MAG TPA: hypothetical protein PKA60_00175 [Candidatus Paceibacterota bacterium]|nr:hypothetical protein [Candidatus Paceibacterota bacterium]
MINIGLISLDIIIIAVIIFVLVLLCLKNKKHYVTALIVSIYPTILIYKNFPFIDFTNKTAEVIFLIIIYFAILFILKRNISSGGNYYSNYLSKILNGVILSVTFVFLLLSVYVHSLPELGNIYNFSSQTTALVANIPIGLSLIIPIVIILFLNKRDN